MTMALPLALTMGEPAGIGGEIALKCWAGRKALGVPTFFMIDDPERLRTLARHLGISVPIKEIRSPESAAKTFDEALPVLTEALAVRAKPGKPDAKNSGAVIRSIERAVEFATTGRAGAVVTNPIHKAVMIKSGFKFPGHTEFLAHLAGGEREPVMMLACSQLRTVLATVHLSLKDAIASLDGAAIERVARTTHDALKRDFSISAPRIAVAGLNPHAGEEGLMGTEEIQIIAPAIERLKAEGINVFGPVAPDTLFSAKARETYDVALCMYHDQGLIPIKTLDFDGGVNVTLGLAFVRTSPDHGTALGIAGTGTASEASLAKALMLAGEMAQNGAG